MQTLHHQYLGGGGGSTSPLVVDVLRGKWKLVCLCFYLQRIMCLDVFCSKILHVKLPKFTPKEKQQAWRNCLHTTECSPKPVTMRRNGSNDLPSQQPPHSTQICVGHSWWVTKQRLDADDSSDAKAGSLRLRSLQSTRYRAAESEQLGIACRRSRTRWIRRRSRGALKRCLHPREEGEEGGHALRCDLILCSNN